MRKIIELKPLGCRVLVERAVASNTTASGRIYMPDTAVEPPAEGIVIAVGPDVVGVAPGDTVVIPRYGGTELIEPGGPVYTVIPVDDIMGVYPRRHDLDPIDALLDEPLAPRQSCDAEACESCQ